MSEELKSKQKLYIYNGIDSQLEEIEDLADAKDYIKDYIEDGEIHPDIESIIILQQVGGVYIEETGEFTELNGDDVPICKIDVFINQQSKPLLEEIERLKQSNERYQQDYSDLQNRLIKQSEMLKFEHKENVRLQSELKSAKSLENDESNASSLIEQYDRLNLASTLDLESINLSLYGLIEYRKRVAREFQKSLLSDESKQQLLSVYDACDFKIIQLLSLPNKPKTN